VSLATGFDDALQLGGRVLDGGLEQVGLAGEVVVEQCFGDARGLGDLAHGDFFEGVLGKEGSAGV